MDFKRSISLEVQDRTRRALQNVNRTLERIRRVTERVNRSQDRTSRATRAWRAAVEGVSTAYRRLRQVVSRATQAAVRGARRVTGALAAAGVAVGGGGIVAARSLQADVRQAGQAGISPNEFRLIREFIKRASSGGLDDEGAFQFISNILERQQEAIAELARQPEKTPQNATGTAIEGLRDLGLIDAINGTSKEFLEAFLNSLSTQQGLIFRGRELAGEEGLAAATIAGLTEAEKLRIQDEIRRDVRLASREDIEATNEFNNNFQRLMTQIRSALSEVFLPLLPTLNNVLIRSVNAVETVRVSIERFRESDSARRIREALGEMQTAFDGFADGIEAVLSRIRPIINAVSPANVSDIPNETPEQRENARFARQRKLQAELRTAEGRLNSFAVQTFGFRREALEAEVDDLTRKLNQVNAQIEAFGDTFTGVAGRINAAGRSIVGGRGTPPPLEPLLGPQ